MLSHSVTTILKILVFSFLPTEVGLKFVKTLQINNNIEIVHTLSAHKKKSILKIIVFTFNKKTKNQIIWKHCMIVFIIFYCSYIRYI